MSLNVHDFMEAFAQKARAAGVEDVRFHLEEITRQQCDIYDHQPEARAESSETLLLAEGGLDGFAGACFTEDLSAKAIPAMVDGLCETARANRIPWQAWDMPTSRFEDVPFTDISDETKALVAAEEAMYAADTRIKKASLSLASQQRIVTLANGQGDIVRANMANVLFTADAMAQKDGAVQTARLCQLYAQKPAYTALATACATEAADTLGAAPCPAGAYAAVMRADVFAELLEAYLPAFFADRTQAGTSLLAGKLGQTLAAPCVTLTELPNGLARRLFDDEGVLTAPKPLIENGVLQTFLYNRQSARKADVPPTGNGYRGQYRAAVTTGYANLHMQTGAHSLPGLLAHMGQGLFITHCDGVFAGANPVSGDFSLLAKGYLVEGGQPARPVSQITIGGNFFELLKDIALLGDNHGTTENPFQNVVCAPSVLVERLQISG